MYSIIPFSWNENTKTLVIGKRAGTFPGMLKKRTFNIVWVREGHGSGLAPEGIPDQTISYDGKQLKVSQQ
jgi:alpha-D-xyloside xylohydrolase